MGSRLFIPTLRIFSPGNLLAEVKSTAGRRAKHQCHRTSNCLAYSEGFPSALGIWSHAGMLVSRVCVKHPASPDAPWMYMRSDNITELSRAGLKKATGKL